MACDCFAQTNTALASDNQRLIPATRTRYHMPAEPDAGIRKVTIQFVGVFIECEKVDRAKRGRPLPVIASYCPFCGTKYEE